MPATTSDPAIPPIEWCAHHGDHIEHGQCWTVVDDPDVYSSAYCVPTPTDARRLWHVELICDQNGVRRSATHGSNGIHLNPDRSLNEPPRTHQFPDHILVRTFAASRHEADEYFDRLAAEYEL